MPNEFSYWSPILGCEATRISLTDNDPKSPNYRQEFYAIVPADELGRVWRERKREAIDHINQAIDLGLKPGEVRWRFSWVKEAA